MHMRNTCKNCGSHRKDHVRGTLKCKTRLKDTTFDPWKPGEYASLVRMYDEAVNRAAKAHAKRE